MGMADPDVGLSSMLHLKYTRMINVCWYGCAATLARLVLTNG